VPLRMTVGELAAASGLTIRTLHHWDEIGLLCPAERSGAGHRRYSSTDVERLYRIVALRRLGLSLDEVGAALDAEGPDLRAAVAAHLGRVRDQLARLRRLEGILGALVDLDEPSTELIIDAIEVMTMSQQYYTPEQLDQLEARREALGEEGMARAQQDWADLIGAMDDERAAGTDVADPRVQALADRWEGMIRQFTGGDPGLTASLKRMYDEQGAPRASRGAMSPELSDYVQRVMAARA
jgi:DNA-binding transcriptional MerR regulator